MHVSAGFIEEPKASAVRISWLGFIIETLAGLIDSNAVLPIADKESCRFNLSPDRTLRLPGNVARTRADKSAAAQCAIAVHCLIAASPECGANRHCSQFARTILRGPLAAAQLEF